MNRIRLLGKKKYSLIFLVIVVILVICLYFIFFSSFYKIVDRTEQLKKFRSADEEKAIGWVKVQGTNIDIPIVYYYSNDVEDPTYNIGWSFNNYKKQEEKMIIYSHNMKNVSSQPLINDKTHQRFEPLMGFIYKSFISDNKYIQYTINGKNYLYKIYGVSFQKKDKFDNYEGNVSKEYKEDYIKNVRKSSYFDMDVDVSRGDKLLTLVTCTRFFGSDDDYSFVIDAREVRKNERVKNYKVNEKKSYKKIEEILKGDVKNE